MRRTTTVFLALFLLLAFGFPVMADAPVATVTVAALNVRGGPGTNYQVIGALQSGDSVAVTGRDDASTWYQVTLSDGQTGWISAAFAHLNADATSVPVVQAPAAPAPAALAVTGGSSNGHHIVFQLSSGGPIYVANPDPSGTVVRQLTTGIDPAISPDGTQVAFTRWSGAQNGDLGSVWIINIDGSNEHKVLDISAQPIAPTWSPDGTELAVQKQQGGYLSTHPRQPGEHCQIVPSDLAFCEGNPFWIISIINIAKGTFTDMPSSPHSFAPTWDPADPTLMAYQGDQGLVSLNVSNRTYWQLTTDTEQWGPIFSPDGGKIADSFRQTDHWEIHTMNADGSGDTRLTETPLQTLVNEQIAGQPALQWNNAAPAWSPDGSQIAFISDRNGPWEIWVMNADGSNQRVLIPASTLDGQAIQYNGMDERVISWK